MSIRTPEELEGLRRVGAFVARTLRRLRGEVRPGVTTGELDALAAREFAKAGARSGPAELVGFPGTICISVNEEVVHGVPGPRRLREGDLVTLDVTPLLDGFCADAAMTVAVGRPRPAAVGLLHAAEAVLRDAVAAAVVGAPLSSIGRAVEQAARGRGLAVFPDLGGHGTGRTMHEPPDVPNVEVPRLRQPLDDGLVLAIEPMVGLGDEELVLRDDGWTIATADGSLAAHLEHTVVVGRDGPLVLTA
ncbi:type I methionyl aminopeptidase [Conexibacter sp. SYSU D00693]|uniref:type I methionyl aminopeptidase n=1 Tax=Conexibacter sp. SYSU D00693 TaxID=2812560 RepID=UPI00196A1F59|nr:type I methionyl aminopeptidase [Conexibacter sp. SYSU D00693]